MNSQQLIKSSVVFEPQTHQYINDNWEILLGVTSLMKKHGLSPDYSAIDPEVLRKAAERGSKVHSDIEMYCKGEQVEETPAIKAFAKLKLDVLDNEYLVSDNEIVASSIDVVLSDYSLADIKTTSTLHLEPLRWQLSIYAYLFELQNPNIKAGKLYGIHIRNGVAKVVEVERIQSVEIERLMQCERNGLTFIASLTPCVEEDKEMIELFNIEQAIVHLKDQIKGYEEAKTKFYETLYTKMENDNIKKLETVSMAITRVLPTMRNSVDSKQLESKYPEVYAEVLKQSEVKGGIKITLKR